MPARTVTVKNPRRKKTLQPELPTGARMITRAQRVSTVRYSRKYPSSFCGLYRYRASTTAPRVQNTAMAIHCSTVRKVRAATPFSGNRAAHAITWASASMPGTPKSASAASRWLNQIPANPMASASAPAAAGSRNRFFIIKRPPAKTLENRLRTARKYGILDKDIIANSRRKGEGKPHDPHSSGGR